MQSHLNARLCSLALLAAALPSMASAAPAYLKLGDIKGETSASIEVESWSWGASKTAAAAPNQNSSRSNHTRVADNTASTSSTEPVTSREAGSGLATGKRQHEPIHFGSPLPQNGSVTVLTARETGSGMATGKRAPACTQGTHIPTVKLEAKGLAVVLTDVTVDECGDGSMTLGYKTAEDLAVRTVEPQRPQGSEQKATRTRSNIQNN